MWNECVENWEGDYPTLGTLWRCEWRKDGENPWRSSGYLIFIGFHARPAPQLEHPLQSAGAFHCSLHWCQHSSTAWPVTVRQCLQQALAIDGFWVGNWEAGIHCSAKGTSIAKPQQGRVISLCPCFPLWSAVFHPACAPPLPAWHQLRSAEHLPKVFRKGSFKPPKLSPGSHLWELNGLFLLL